MRNIIFGGIILAIIGLLVFAFVSRSQSTATALSFATVQTDVSNGAHLYDVRTTEEYSEGHFAHADNFSLQTMQAGTLPSVAKDSKIYVYCHSGNRSSQAFTVLKQAGYTNVTDLGGLAHVESIGGTLTKE